MEPTPLLVGELYLIRTKINRQSYKCQLRSQDKRGKKLSLCRKVSKTSTVIYQGVNLKGWQNHAIAMDRIVKRKHRCASVCVTPICITIASAQVALCG